MEEGTSQIDEYIQSVLRPDYVESLRFPHQDKDTLTVYVFQSNQEDPSETLTVDGVYPFTTLQEISYRIYELLGSKQEAHPIFQFLGIPPPSVDPAKQSPWYTPAAFLWKDERSALDLKSPFTQAASAKPDDRFISSSGESRILTFTPRQEGVLEDILFRRKPATVLHLFLYSTVSAAIPGVRPFSEEFWKGKVIPYFPRLTRAEQEGTLSAAQAQEAPLFLKRITQRFASIQLLNDLLEGGTPLEQLSVGGIKHMRFQWSRRSKEAIDTLFYDLDVRHAYPFLRFLPVEGSPITKIHVRSEGLPIPSLEDPHILTQWAQEKSPTPEHDCIIGKILLREGVGKSTPPLYATARVFQDGSADLIIQPPRQVKKLSPLTDLANLSQTLASEIPRMKLPLAEIQLKDISFYLGLRMRRDAPKLTRKGLLRKLGAFRAFFQETAPLSGETPLLSLRYKAVSNFTSENRIFTFCTQVTRRNLVQGQALSHQLVDLVSTEFQLGKQEALQYVAAWFEKSDDVTVISPETLEYTATYNPGADISLFAQHPVYSFHIYRVESVLILRRVITLLAMLLSIDESEFTSVPPLEQQEEAEVEQSHDAGQEEQADQAIPEGSLSGDEDADELGTAGAQMPDEMMDLLFDPMMESGELDESAAEGAAPVTLESVLKGDVPSPVEEMGDIPVSKTAAAPTRAVPPPAPAADEDSDEEADGSNLKETAAATYYITRLKKYDRRLFDYTKEHPSLKKYVRQCSSNAFRQPTVMSYDEYESMKETYADDPVVFLEYGAGKTELPDVPASHEAITVLEYGSNLLQPNFYICAKYWCRQDEIVVLEKDFLATQDRNTPPRPKPAKTCPFCRGTLVSGDRKTVQRGETVLERMPKAREKEKDKRHLYVGFLGKVVHPEGLYLPCCFLKEDTIPKTHPAFTPLTQLAKEQTVQGTAAAGEEDAAEDDEEGAPIVSSIPELERLSVDYEYKSKRLHRAYILGAEKLPLEVAEEPQVGLLLPVLDQYFQQDPAALVERTFTTMGLKESSAGFLRIGVENRQRFAAESFLAAIAPFLGRNTAQQVKRRLMEVITPSLFVRLNYGNFLFEYYNVSARPLSPKELQRWANDHLQVTMNSENTPAIQRIWRAYTHFLASMEDPSVPKEYRQFAEVLATPGLVTANGLLLLILDVSYKGTLTVRCPPYGIRPDLVNKADISILLHHESGIWEPILYTNNRKATGAFPESHQTNFTFQRALEADWPPILRKRVEEFVSTCVGPSHGVYTSQTSIDSRAILPLSRATRMFRVSPEALLRDSYNHVAGLVYRVSPVNPGMVVLPVVDDGTHAIYLRLQLDWNDFKPAQANDVVEFYNKYFYPVLPIKQGYRIQYQVRNAQDKTVEALQLENGLYIPVSPNKSGDPVPKLPAVENDFFEWSLNRDIAFGMKEGEHLELRADQREIEELFQHLRLTFSNWLVSEHAGPSVRKEIESVLQSKEIMLFEKRKRLEILLSSTVLSWMNSDPNHQKKKKQQTLLRVDCRVRAKDSCSNRCAWNSEKDRCALHVPSTTSVGDYEDVDVPTLLLRRLLEELLRYPEYRKQLMNKGVSPLVSIHSAIRMKDQYILPESTPNWAELLRMDWLNKQVEQPKFLEEFSREASAPAAPPPTEEEEAPEEAAEEAAEEGAVKGVKGVLPESLLQILGATNSKTLALSLFTPKTEEGESTLAPFLSWFNLEESEGAEGTPTMLTSVQLKQILKSEKVSVLQINLLDPANPTIFVRRAVFPGHQTLPVLCFVVTRGPSAEGAEKTSILTLDAAHPTQPNPFDSLPALLQKKLEKADTIRLNP